MSEITYRVIGPTDIEVVVEYDATYANVCWLGETSEKINDCETRTTVEKYCEPVSFDPVDKCAKNPPDYTGSITWQGIQLTYSIKRRTYPCDGDCETPPAPEGCAMGEMWIETKNDNIVVYYEKYHINQNNEPEKVIRSISSSVSCDDETHVISGKDECCNVYYEYSCKSECKYKVYFNILNIVLKPATVQYGGGKVSYSINYERIEELGNCSKKIVKGSLSGSIIVPACHKDCCNDHNVDIADFTVDSIRNRLGPLAEDADIMYNGRILEDSDIITLSVLQKGSNGSECDDACEYHDTYCVLDDSNHKIKVEYETYFGSNQWITEEEGGVIPSYGGRVRVSFDYEMHRKPIGTLKGCKEKIVKGSDKVIARVGDCFTSNDPLQISGEILYKERYNDCTDTTHVSGERVLDPVEGKEILMNLIKYDVNQDCSIQCSPGEYKTYNEKTVNVEACDNIVETKVGYTKITVYKDERGKCHTDTEVVDDEHGDTIRVSFSENKSKVERTIDKEYLHIIQAAGPCDVPDCDCDKFELNSDEGVKPCEEGEITYYVMGWLLIQLLR